jgi:long-chain acyl-CoA synthetase
MELTRLFDILEYQQKNFPLERSFGHNLNGQWVYYSTDDMVRLSDQMASGLLGLGLEQGDKIAIIAYKNRPEWTIMDLAIQKAGMVSIPVYPTISSKDYEYIFNDAGVKYAFVGGGDLYDKVNRAKPKIETFKDIYTFDRQEGRLYWEDIMSEEHLDKVYEIMKNVKPSDLFTIIYTSGTTGNPKGVMLTHHNIISNTLVVKDLFPNERGSKVLSFLPLCHIFERNASFAYLYSGFEVVFTGTDNLGGEEGDLKTVQPHFFTTVPRLLEKVYEKIYNKGLALTGVKRNLFFWA